MGIRNLQFARNAKATVPKLSKEMRAYVLCFFVPFLVFFFFFF